MAKTKEKPLIDKVHTRAPYWQDVPDEKWLDWRWQMSHRLNSLEELEQVINLTPSEREALGTSGLFRVDITPYFASLIDPDDPTCPVRKQVIPTAAEMVPFHSMMEDSLAEDKHSPVPGLVHRYPDRVLMLVTTQCASYCRYCTRSRIVGDPTQTFSRSEFDAQIEYIEKTPQIRDVLLSGGDPLVLAPKLLEMILSRLRAIPHLEIIRIGSRVPVFLPMRVTEEFCRMIEKYHPLWLNIHVNAPKEVTPELGAAADRLTRAGVPLGNQSVLLAGVNDSVNIQRKLAHELVKIRVRPYYLYQCDLVAGAGHLRTSVSKGIEIIEGLRGHTSGYAVPTYVIDAPGGGGKIPVQPNYVLSQAPGRIVLRNFEGFITTYEEPLDYDPHAIESQDAKIERRLEPGQEGIYGLLEGQRMFIEPEGFEDIHARGGAEHRLRSDELAQKWKPLGVGAVEGEQSAIPAELPETVDGER
ncbi:MAG TPA: lysine 2,3-aminomutase [Anaerolineae bacterium]|nr:lysine 2,3-aminomutase [Anaerolineae bacterium]HIP72195.1 lysine 2,3-aminomutase [Anaerolineae bacterium]